MLFMGGPIPQNQHGRQNPHSEPLHTLDSRGEFPKIGECHFGVSYNKDYSILGSIFGSPYLGKLPEFTASEGWFSVLRSAALFSGFGISTWLKPRLVKFKL